MGVRPRGRFRWSSWTAASPRVPPGPRLPRPSPRRPRRRASWLPSPAGRDGACASAPPRPTHLPRARRPAGRPHVGSPASRRPGPRRPRRRAPRTPASDRRDLALPGSAGAGPRSSTFPRRTRGFRWRPQGPPARLRRRRPLARSPMRRSCRWPGSGSRRTQGGVAGEARGSMPSSSALPGRLRPAGLRPGGPPRPPPPAANLLRRGSASRRPRGRVRVPPVGGAGRRSGVRTGTLPPRKHRRPGWVRTRSSRRPRTRGSWDLLPRARRRGGVGTGVRGQANATCVASDRFPLGRDGGPPGSSPGLGPARVIAHPVRPSGACVPRTRRSGSSPGPASGAAVARLLELHLAARPVHRGDASPASTSERSIPAMVPAPMTHLHAVPHLGEWKERPSV
jgi:hypothetical protein